MPHLSEDAYQSADPADPEAAPILLPPEEIKRLRQLLRRAALNNQWPDHALDFVLVSLLSVGAWIVYSGSELNAEHAEEHILHYMFGEDLTPLADTFAYPYAVALLLFATRSLMRRITAVRDWWRGGDKPLDPNDRGGYYTWRAIVGILSLFSGAVGAINNIQSKKSLILIILAYAIAASNNENVASKARKLMRTVLEEENGVIEEWRKVTQRMEQAAVHNDMLTAQSQLQDELKHTYDTFMKALPIILARAVGRVDIDTVYKIFNLSHALNTTGRHLFPPDIQDFLNTFPDDEVPHLLNMMLCAAHFSDTTEEVALLSQRISTITLGLKLLGIGIHYLGLALVTMPPSLLNLGVSSVAGAWTIASLLGLDAFLVNAGILGAENNPTKSSFKCPSTVIDWMLAGVSEFTTDSLGFCISVIVHRTLATVFGPYGAIPWAALPLWANTTVYRPAVKTLTKQVVKAVAGATYPGMPTLEKMHEQSDPRALETYINARWLSWLGRKAFAKWVAVERFKGSLQNFAHLAKQLPNGDKFAEMFLQIFQHILKTSIVPAQPALSIEMQDMPAGLYPIPSHLQKIHFPSSVFAAEVVEDEDEDEDEEAEEEEEEEEEIIAEENEDEDDKKIEDVEDWEDDACDDASSSGLLLDVENSTVVESRRPSVLDHELLSTYFAPRPHS